jgi:hypothetical protein
MEDRINKLIIIHNKRLQLLEEKAALFGSNTDPAILIEITEIKNQIEKLQKESSHYQKKADEYIQKGHTSTTLLNASSTSTDIRNQLTHLYTADEISFLCYDHFRDAYEQISHGMAKSTVIQILIEYCERNNKKTRLINLINDKIQQ